MRPLLKKALLRTLGIFLLIIPSTLLFVYVEHTEKDDREEKYQLLRTLYNSMASKYNMTIEEFNNFSNAAFEALSVPKPRWTYLTAADFVLQAITTIGYGYITPQTPTGQILCIFVSLLGIPITLLALQSLGELIAKLVNASVRKFEKKFLRRAETKQVQTKSAVFLFSLMIWLMIATGYALKTNSGNWTFVEGVYFCFITFSTIGFGDYIIKEPTTSIKKLCVNDSVCQENKEASDDSAYLSTLRVFTYIMFMCYYIIALCIVSSVLNSIMLALEERRCRPRCRGCFFSKTEDHVTSMPYNPPQQSETGTLNMTHLSTNNFGLREGQQEIPRCLDSMESTEDHEPEAASVQY